MGAARVLVVDDEEEFLNMLVDEFKEKGFEVKALQNGFNAAETIRNEHFDALVVDLKLPGLDGMQVAAVARSSKSNRTSSITVVSGVIDKAAAEKARKLSVDGILVKPCKPEDVVNSVDEVLKKKNAAASYDLRVVKCFVAAAKEVLEFYFGQAPKIGKPFVKKSKKSTGYVTGLIGFSGSGIMGSVSITSDTALMKKLSEKVFMGESVELDDEMIGDLAGEMANQVIGKVKINFGELGVNITIGLPEVVTGENHTIFHKANNPVLTVPVEHEGAHCHIEVCMTDDVEEQIDEDNAPKEKVESVILWD